MILPRKKGHKDQIRGGKGIWLIFKEFCLLCIFFFGKPEIFAKNSQPSETPKHLLIKAFNFSYYTLRK